MVQAGSMGDYEIRPLGPDTWDAYAALIAQAQRHLRGLLGHLLPLAGASPGADLRQQPRAQVPTGGGGPAHAAVVFDGTRPSGGRSTGHRTSSQHPSPQAVPRAGRRPPRLPDHVRLRRPRPPTARGHSDRHPGRPDLIAQAGGGVVEGYPHEKPTKKVSSSFLYNGTRPLYERMGFEYVRPKGLKNTVMRRTVEPARSRPRHRGPRAAGRVRGRTSRLSRRCIV